MTLHDELAVALARRDADGGWRREPEPGYAQHAWVTGRLDKVKRAWCSAHGVTLLNERLRIVDADVAPYMPGEIARARLRETLGDWLVDRSPRYRRIPFHRQASEYRLIPPPTYFEPPADRNGPWAIVDIDACYPSLYSRLGTVLEYRPEWDPPLLRSIGPAWQRSDEWLSVRAPRLALWGMLRSPGVTEYRFGHPAPRQAPNRFLSPDLVGVVMHTIHAVATEAIDRFPTICGWHVDSCTLRPAEAEPYIAWLAGRWGISASVRASSAVGYVWGPVTRDIGVGDERNVTVDVLTHKAKPQGPRSNLIQLSGSHRELLRSAYALV